MASVSLLLLASVGFSINNILHILDMNEERDEKRGNGMWMWMYEALFPADVKGIIVVRTEGWASEWRDVEFGIEAGEEGVVRRSQCCYLVIAYVLCTGYFMISFN